MLDMTSLFDWLLHGAPGVTDALDLYTRVGVGLSNEGIPVARMVAFIRTLHPHIMSRRFEWRAGQTTRVSEIPHSILSSSAYLGSPVHQVVSTGKTLRQCLPPADGPSEHAILDELVAEGMTCYLAVPILFMNGEVHTMTFATKHPLGFTDEQVEAIHRLVVPLSRIIEIMALRRTAANLLNTYVGRNAGERILAGKIKPGDTETIQAVIWFSDLRGFTSLSASMESNALIRTLNEVFDCQVASIERRGGEVLKYIGDGLLAIFPTDAIVDKAKVCADTLDAADEAFVALQSLNAQRTDRGDPAVRFGLALHIGDVAYGNIGGRARLDFTCIGPAVNLAARLEGLTGRLERDVVTSSAFASLVDRPMETLGLFSLKGVPQPEEVFAPKYDGRR